MSSQASNPTNLNVEKLQLMKFKKFPWVWLLCLIVSSILTYKFGGWYNYIFLIFSLFANWFYWWIQNRSFNGGDFTYGKVVSVSPTLIAVPTNMSNSGGGNFPAVGIIETKLKKIGKNPIINGDRIPMIGLYQSNNDSSLPFWGEFNPIPVYQGYTNLEVLNEKFKQFSDSKLWSELDSKLNQVPKPFAVGLYRIDENESGWKEYKKL